jgi:hypothetical protein
MFDPNMQFPDWPGSHPAVQCQFFPVLISWMLAYPDRSAEEVSGVALCAGGWALDVSGESEKGLAQIAQGLKSDHGALQHILPALQADAQLAIGKPEAALASVTAGLKAVEKMGERRLKRSSIGSGAKPCSPLPGR